MKILKTGLPMFILLILLILGGFVYYFFWPRFIFTEYSYHDYSTTNEHSEWWVTFDTSGPIDPPADTSTWWGRVHLPLNKYNIYGNPYHLGIWHDSGLNVGSVEIIDSQEVVFSSSCFKRITHNTDAGKRILTRCKYIDLRKYKAYELVVYYTLNDQKEAGTHTIKIPLETNFVDVKVSRFQIALGI